MPEIIDVTVTISSSLPTWPGDPSVVLERIDKIEDGANANVSHMDISVHTGTHVDAPFHFITGADTVENLDLDTLIGPAQVIFVEAAEETIERSHLEQAGVQPGVTRLLLKTRNSEYWNQSDKGFQTGFAGLSADASQYLLELGIKLIGIDYLSIAPYKNSRPTHEVLLGAEVVIIEGLDLRKVEPGLYTLLCMPLKLANTDGAPARVVLLKE